MRIYTVGGAVRDALLGLPVQDRDYVVVGATPGELLARGFKPGRQGFSGFPAPQDARRIRTGAHRAKIRQRLRRLHLPRHRMSLSRKIWRAAISTINAIAQAEDGTLTDPYGGLADIKARGVAPCRSGFIEDPVRILRIARFPRGLPILSWPPKRWP